MFFLQKSVNVSPTKSSISLILKLVVFDEFINYSSFPIS